MANTIVFKKNTDAPTANTSTVIGEPLFEYNAASGSVANLYMGWGSGDGEYKRVGAIIDSSTNLDAGSATNDKVPTQLAVKTYADTMLPLAGGTISGNIVCAGSETVDGKDVSTLGTDAEAHAYVEANALTLTAALTMSGAGITIPTGQDITLTDAPGSDTDAANKAYVDTTAAGGDTSLSSGKIWIGNVSDVKAEFAVTGDVAMTAGGVTTIQTDAVNSLEIVAGAIDLAHMSANSVDSTQYVDGSVDFEHIQNVAANSILGRNANSSGVLSEIALATTQILIGDGTGFTAAALSGDVSMTNGGVVTAAAAQPNITSVGTLSSLTTSGAITSGGDFTVTGGMLCEAGGDAFFDGTVECNQLECTGDVTIDGDVQINGTQTIVDSTVVSIADPVFEMGASGSDDNLDRGIKMKYNSGGAKIAFMGFDDSDGKFVMIADATDTSSVFSGTQATLKANLAGTVTLDGNTITGIDDSAEFTDDDAHIMTSAAVQDKILGYSYLDGNSNIGGGTYTTQAG